MKMPALQEAVSAIAASIIGRQYDNRDLVNESLRFYTNGLRELQKSLWDTGVMYDDEILAICLCLGLYEAMECPGDARQAYYNHCKACLRLVEARGAHRHMSGVAHELFRGIRAQGVSLSPERGKYKVVKLSEVCRLCLVWRTTFLVSCQALYG